jgi:hypothetical protein
LLSAISENGVALEFASDDLKDDEDVVLAAFSKYNGAILHASTRQKNDMNKNRTSAKMVVRDDGLALQYGSKAVQNDKEIIMEAVRQN